MLQGRDGIGAAPCCGTGVVFRRDVLVSVGGQAYGSITEVSSSKTTWSCSNYSRSVCRMHMRVSAHVRDGVNGSAYEPVQALQVCCTPAVMTPIPRRVNFEKPKYAGGAENLLIRMSKCISNRCTCIGLWLLAGLQHRDDAAGIRLLNNVRAH